MSDTATQPAPDTPESLASNGTVYQPQPYPILEYDPSPDAIINPRGLIEPIDIPAYCVQCFFQDVIEKLRAEQRLKLIIDLRSEMGKHPVYEFELNGQRLALFHPGVGASLAGGFLEELIALGCRKFIACGGAGVLDKQIAVGHLIIPRSAVRDEGTSYHYLPPAREVNVAQGVVETIEKVLQNNGMAYVIAKTWTTDGFYRETPAKIKQRRAEGCLTVEMEAAAFFAVAQFRGVPFGQILYGGDDISGAEWDSRHWDKRATVREKVFWLAAEACLGL
jgi:uridine phosphorylase